MPETLCPRCGHSPIPEGSESCPACGEPFNFQPLYKRAQRKMVDKRRDHVDIEQTVFGGNLTGEVSAHPGPIAAVFFVGALAWFLRAGGVVGHLEEPSWTYGVVLVDLVLGLVLILNLGPAQLLAQVGMVLQLGVAGYLARAAPLAPVHLGYIAHALVALAVVVGEPGPVRRYGGLGVGSGVALLGVIFLAAGVGLEAAPGGGTRQRLVGPELGFQLELPPGWSRLAPEQLAPHLSMPAATLTGSGVGFGDVGQGRYGLLWVDREAGEAKTGCQRLLQALGANPASALSAQAAPPALGSKASVYELKLATGAQGSFGCGQLADGRLVGLAVVSASPGATAAFAAVGSGLTLQ